MSEVWIGVREGALLAILVVIGCSGLGWTWVVGVVWGVGAMAAGRFAWWLMFAPLARGGGKRFWIGLMVFSRELLVAALAIGGILFGLAPLAVATGLLLPILGLWGRLLLRPPKIC